MVKNYEYLANVAREGMVRLIGASYEAAMALETKSTEIESLARNISGAVDEFLALVPDI